MNNETQHYEPIPDARIVHPVHEDRGVLGALARANDFRRRFPDPLKRFLRRFLPRDKYRLQQLRSDPFYYAKPRPDYTPRETVKVGILADPGLKHKYPIAACLDLGVGYELMDIASPDWMEIIAACPEKLVLANPTIDSRPRRQMYDERLAVVAGYLGKELFPDALSLWIYESKHRMFYWLKANGFPIPRTAVFYDVDRALRFCLASPLPIVCKTDLGAGAAGVNTFRDRVRLTRFVKSHFGKGTVRCDSDPRDREWGSLLVQEYLPNAREWRMLRIGDSYFGYEKVKVGDFHSGSHAWNYSRPSNELLDLLRAITDRGNFRSMDLDILQAEDGRLLVNEMQAVFGMGNPYEMCVVDDQPGRMLWDDERRMWHFQAGRFCQNHMWNLRLRYLLHIQD